MLLCLPMISAFLAQWFSKAKGRARNEEGFACSAKGRGNRTGVIQSSHDAKGEERGRMRSISSGKVKQ